MFKFIILIEGKGEQNNFGKLEKIQSLRKQIKVMKERERIADKEVKTILARKFSFWEQLDRTIARIMNLERVMQSGSVPTSDLLSDEFEGEEQRIARRGEIIMRSVLGDLLDKVRAFSLVEKQIDDDLRCASESHIGAQQILRALESDLEELEASSI